MFGAHALFSLGVLVAAIATGLARELGAQPAHVLGTIAVVTAVIAAGSISAARAGHAGIADESQAGPRALKAASSIAVLAALCALAFLVEDAIQNWSALHIERGLGASPAVGGAAPGVFAGAMFIGRSLGQRLGARFSDRSLLSGGATAAGIGIVVLAVAPNPLVALGGLAVAGAGISTVAPALFARAGRMTDARNRGAAIARVTALGYSGFVIGPGLVGVLAQLTDLRTSIAALAALAFAMAIGGFYVLRDSDRSGTFAEGEELLKTGRA
jgi:MFS family permease